MRMAANKVHKYFEVLAEGRHGDTQERRMQKTKRYALLSSLRRVSSEWYTTSTCWETRLFLRACRCRRKGLRH